MQLFSQWSPLPSPNRRQKEQKERERQTPLQIERAKMKSAPIKPMLSGPILFGQELEGEHGQNKEEDLQSKLNKNPYEALARHRSEKAERGEPHTPEAAMDVTT